MPFVIKMNTNARPQSDWIEIQDVTPAIISQELFDAAQKRLETNQKKTVPTTRHEYLSRGHIRCRQCGRAYVGSVSVSTKKDKRYEQRYYSCRGKLKMYAPLERCHNKGWSARKLEGMVWSEFERYLSDPNIILAELEKQRQDAGQTGMFEAELDRIERQFKALNRE
ncbi:recombinase zinc beta ribbon domain-containing protein [Chloroflexota bacterium]